MQATKQQQQLPPLGQTLSNTFTYSAQLFHLGALTGAKTTLALRRSKLISTRKPRLAAYTPTTTTEQTPKLTKVIASPTQTQTLARAEKWTYADTRVSRELAPPLPPSLPEPSPSPGPLNDRHQTRLPHHPRRRKPQHYDRTLQHATSSRPRLTRPLRWDTDDRVQKLLDTPLPPPKPDPLHAAVISTHCHGWTRTFKRTQQHATSSRPLDPTSVVGHC